ncbi:MAG: formyl transferase [Deltaproteobacteria bacterium]|nr:formyl transferase [Deltaproteobacteria bacterium]MBW2017314.1 formyl transferase [Deltaproteobacteria bacterium]MBW2128785.1 formyl transferase [Deltaproteobacteria bacterium]
MAPKPIFDPEKAGRPMRVAAFMSGSGTNIVKLLEAQKRLEDEEGRPPYEVVFIFSDRSDGTSRGEEIARAQGIPYFSYDIRAFHSRRGLKRTVSTPEGLAARKAYDEVARKLIHCFEIDVVALGGYMSYITLGRCINVHPADLSILTPQGKRKYVGEHAVLDAILAGETHLRSSTIWTDEGVDTGPLLMVSNPLKVELPAPLEVLEKDRKRLLEVAGEHQRLLKEKGDWRIFPRTLEMVARGRFALDDEGRVYVDGEPVPDGFRE